MIQKSQGAAGVGSSLAPHTTTDPETTVGAPKQNTKFFREAAKVLAEHGFLFDRKLSAGAAHRVFRNDDAFPNVIPIANTPRDPDHALNMIRQKAQRNVLAGQKRREQTVKSPPGEAFITWLRKRYDVNPFGHVDKRFLVTEEIKTYMREHGLDPEDRRSLNSIQQFISASPLVVKQDSKVPALWRIHGDRDLAVGEPKLRTKKRHPQAVEAESMSTGAGPKVNLADLGTEEQAEQPADALDLTTEPAPPDPVDEPTATPIDILPTPLPAEAVTASYEAFQADIDAEVRANGGIRLSDSTMAELREVFGGVRASELETKLDLVRTALGQVKAEIDAFKAAPMAELATRLDQMNGAMDDVLELIGDDS